ncbi:MAG: inositol monophosphatase family protein [Sediminibacterium sp.]|nr:inositol monophosphatase family protein [Sediminibacterium sp.]
MFENILKKATLKGGELIKEYFYKDYKIDYKVGINNLVTEIDIIIENEIKAIIHSEFPDHKIIGEESGNNQKHSEYNWIIDPIDGTINFFHKIPLCCTSIGLEKNNEIIMGAVYNPLMNEFFFAAKNQGSTLNDKPIKVSNNDNMTRAMLVTGFPYDTVDANRTLSIFEKIVRQGISIRRLGSAALDLCWVAAGRFDVFYETNLKPWDSAGGLIIVNEAGGLVTDFNNHNYSIYNPTIIASNKTIHNKFIEFIA